MTSIDNQRSSPSLAVIIPVRNERRTLGQVLTDLHAQDWPHPFTVAIADGASDDGTRALLDDAVLRQPYRFRLIVVENAIRHIPAGLNAAVAAVPDAELVIRIDGHSRVPTSYLSTIAQALRDNVGDIVGPSIHLLPGASTGTAEVIAACLGTRLGTGGTPSRRRLQEPKHVVHTVMSCWRRSVWVRLNGYDESLLSNEDFDFDWRATQAGLKVVSLPEPRFELLARSTLGSLWRQRWRYGWWKAAMIRKSPRSLQARQVLPVAAIAVALASLYSPPVTIILGSAYLLVSWMTAAQAIRQEGRSAKAWFALPWVAPAAFICIHGAWTIGLLAGLILNHPRKLNTQIYVK